MKRFVILIVTFSLLFFLLKGIPTQAQTTSPIDDHTAQEEAEGKEIWEKLQAKKLECKDLTNDNYAVLGEYFMGQSIGNTQRHTAMNLMMTSMMGKEGEEQMHVVMGKRMSSCDTRTKGGGNPMMGTGFGNMMGGWGGFGLGWIFMIVFWILIILGIVALVRYLGNSGKTTKDDETPLEILKERYAKGEIDKKEFEEMKKNLRFE